MFTPVNHLIAWCWENGWSSFIYNGGVVLAFVIQLVYLCFYRKHYALSAKKTILMLVLVYPILYYWMLFLCWVENGFTNWGNNNVVRIFVWAPLLFWAVARILKEKPNVILDFVAPSMALEQAVGHAVCPFAGCCRSFDWEYGIWNPVVERNLFPNQWLECLVAFVVFFWLRHRAKKGNYDGSGTLYPLFLISFGATRCLLEFLRDNDKIFYGLSVLALHALGMVLVGVVWLLIKKRKAKS